MPTTTVTDDTLDHRHRLGTTGSPTAAAMTRRPISHLGHHTDEAATLAVAAGDLAEVGGDGASS
ncbi:hypothetical protein [Micromonospora aurantiaca (nom. illeg.)]|uniref:hypothetical protein n=1 Tax=Micromonospora aurantiaca (nom. illeg.) TaxID=47850 RepID=UPI0033F70FE1